uniref:Uncharacterized protein n=1 Tax=Caldisericum exile TaxID=693075 RepID=A0A7C4YE69_9BACT
MANLKWVAGETLVTALSTELNSLANNTFSSLSAEIDNTTGLYPWMSLELYLASFTPGAGSPYVACWLVLCLDGTNYEKTPNGSSGDKPPDAIFPLEAGVAQASRIIIADIPIPPLKFKLVVQNKSGAALAATGNTLKYSRHYAQVV